MLCGVIGQVHISDVVCPVNGHSNVIQGLVFNGCKVLLTVVDVGSILQANFGVSRLDDQHANSAAGLRQLSAVLLGVDGHHGIDTGVGRCLGTAPAVHGGITADVHDSQAVHGASLAVHGDGNGLGLAIIGEHLGVVLVALGIHDSHIRNAGNNDHGAADGLGIVSGVELANEGQLDIHAGGQCSGVIRDDKAILVIHAQEHRLHHAGGGIVLSGAGLIIISRGAQVRLGHLLNGEDAVVVLSVELQVGLIQLGSDGQDARAQLRDVIGVKDHANHQVSAHVGGVHLILEGQDGVIGKLGDELGEALQSVADDAQLCKLVGVLIQLGGDGRDRQAILIHLGEVLGEDLIRGGREVQIGLAGQGGKALLGEVAVQVDTAGEYSHLGVSGGALHHVHHIIGRAVVDMGIVHSDDGLGGLDDHSAHIGAHLHHFTGGVALHIQGNGGVSAGVDGSAGAVVGLTVALHAVVGDGQIPAGGGLHAVHGHIHGVAGAVVSEGAVIVLRATLVDELHVHQLGNHHKGPGDGLGVVHGVAPVENVGNFGVGAGGQLRLVLGDHEVALRIHAQEQVHQFLLGLVHSALVHPGDVSAEVIGAVLDDGQGDDAVGVVDFPVQLGLVAIGGDGHVVHGQLGLIVGISGDRADDVQADIGGHVSADADSQGAKLLRQGVQRVDHGVQGLLGYAKIDQIALVFRQLFSQDIRGNAVAQQGHMEGLFQPLNTRSHLIRQKQVEFCGPAHHILAVVLDLEVFHVDAHHEADQAQVRRISGEINVILLAILDDVLVHIDHDIRRSLVDSDNRGCTAGRIVFIACERNGDRLVSACVQVLRADGQFVIFHVDEFTCLVPNGNIQCRKQITFLILAVGDGNRARQLNVGRSTVIIQRQDRSIAHCGILGTAGISDTDSLLRLSAEIVGAQIAKEVHKGFFNNITQPQVIHVFFQGHFLTGSSPILVIPKFHGQILNGDIVDGINHTIGNCLHTNSFENISFQITVILASVIRHSIVISTQRGQGQIYSHSNRPSGFNGNSTGASVLISKRDFVLAIGGVYVIFINRSNFNDNFDIFVRRIVNIRRRSCIILLIIAFSSDNNRSSIFLVQLNLDGLNLILHAIFIDVSHQNGRVSNSIAAGRCSNSLCYLGVPSFERVTFNAGLINSRRSSTILNIREFFQGIPQAININDGVGFIIVCDFIAINIIAQCPRILITLRFFVLVLITRASQRLTITLLGMIISVSAFRRLRRIGRIAEFGAVSDLPRVCHFLSFYCYLTSYFTCLFTSCFTCFFTCFFCSFFSLPPCSHISNLIRCTICRIISIFIRLIIDGIIIRVF